MNRQKLQEILEICSKTLSEEGLRCIETRWNAHERRLQVFIDFLDRLSSKEDPLEIEACVVATRLLDEKSPLDDLFKTPYELEVSSPGIERPIRLIEDFKALVGEVVHLHLSEPLNGKRRFEGQLEGVEEPLDIHIQSEGAVHTVSLDHLLKANLVYDWSSTKI